MINFIKKHIDFNFNLGAIIAFLTLIICIFTYNILPEKFGWENGFIENIQMFVLFLACFFSLKIKDIDNKKFFIFCFLVLLIIILREVNYGRTLFFPIPNIENAFYSWSEIKYGFIVEPLVAIYLFGMGCYFLANQLWKNFFNLLTKTKLPIFNLIFLIIGLIIGMYSEKHLHNDILEEFGELIMYISIFSIVYIYSSKKIKSID